VDEGREAGFWAGIKKALNVAPLYVQGNGELSTDLVPYVGNSNHTEDKPYINEE
jgi:hypothetical protein